MDGPDEATGLQTLACALVGPPDAFHPPTASRHLSGGSAVVISTSVAIGTASLPPPAVLMHQLQQQSGRPPQGTAETSRRAVMARSTDNSSALATVPDLGVATSAADDCCGQSGEVYLPDLSSSMLSAHSQQLTTQAHGALGRFPTRPASQLAGAVCTAGSLDVGGSGAGGRMANGFGVMASACNRNPSVGVTAAGGAGAGSLQQLQLLLPTQTEGAAPRAPALSSSSMALPSVPSLPSRNFSHSQPSVSGCGKSLDAAGAGAAATSSQPPYPAQPHGNAGALSPVLPASSGVARGDSRRCSSRLGSVAAIASAAMSLLAAVGSGSAGAGGSALGSSGCASRSRDSSTASLRRSCGRLPPYVGASANAVGCISPAFGASPCAVATAALATAQAAAAGAAAAAAATGSASVSLRASGIVMDEIDEEDSAEAAGLDEGGSSARRPFPGSSRFPAAKPAAGAVGVGSGGSGPMLRAAAGEMEEVEDVRRLRVGSCWSDPVPGTASLHGPLFSTEQQQQQQQQQGLAANAADTILRITDLDTCWAELRDLAFLGSGACGNVYTGTWCGMPVAAKFMISGSEDQLQRQQREAALSRLASHPHLVQTYAVALDQLRASHFRRPQPGSGVDGGGLFLRNSAGADLLGTCINEGAFFDTCLTTAPGALNNVAHGPGGAGGGAGTAGGGGGREVRSRGGQAGPAQPLGGWHDTSDAGAGASGKGGRGGAGGYMGARDAHTDIMFSSEANAAFPAAVVAVSGAGSDRRRDGTSAGAWCPGATSEALSPPRPQPPQGHDVLGPLRACAAAGPARSERHLDASGSTSSPQAFSPLAATSGDAHSSRSGRSQQQRQPQPRHHPAARSSQRVLAAFSSARHAATASVGVSLFACDSAASSGFVGAAGDGAQSQQSSQSQHRPHLDTIAISTMEDLHPAVSRLEGCGAGMGRRRDSFDLRTCASDADGPDASSFQPSDVLAHIGARPGQWLTVVIMEEMDRGSLHRAIHGGIFDATASHLIKRHRVRGMVRTLVEVAQGMAALHASGLVHGDLKPANVLLKAQTRGARGFYRQGVGLWQHACDAGGRVGSDCDHQRLGHRDLHSAGGVQRQQRPALRRLLVRRADVAPDQLPHEDLNPFAVLLAVSKGELELEWPSSVPKPLRRLGQLCMQHDPATRPTLTVIARALLKLEQRMKQSAVSAAASPQPGCTVNQQLRPPQNK
ncbi:hypothetical protein HXX76_006735 [Chlamydomonas incerta]|uniref:Tyrosine-protein kinase catalytic domain-containing protein n=1 Tax=Chlamydomonas incerta TaxID=51695 RepID=A0A835T000_CHLIN|nr:hypothetical protein HXX76_006735 [Chlamydomonas incerta]|eukprot:KAG2436432.1 hypothetical protein HXX76_006735 [Chlamydomonas incerta]